MDIEQSFSQDDVSLTFPMRKDDAAPMDIRSNNSMLSSDEEDDDGATKRPLLADPSLYMEQASMEATPAEPPGVTKIEASGRLGRRLSSRSECILVENDSSFALIDGNLGLSRSGGEDSVMSHRLLLAQSESDVFAAPETEASSTLTGSVGAPEANVANTNQPQQQQNDNPITNGNERAMKQDEGQPKGSPRHNDNNWSILKRHGILVSKKKKNGDNKHLPPWKKKKTDSDALYALLETFCDPPVSIEACRASLLLEETQLYEDTPDITLPDPLPMISLHHEEQNSIVALLLHPQCLLELSTPFVAAILRLLVRLLSGESNTEYSVAVGALSPIFLPSQHIPSSADTTNSPSTNSNDAYYQVVRFQCAWMQHCNSTNAADDKLAVATVLDLREQYKQQLPSRPLARLVAVCAAAGVTPHLLRRLRFHVQPTRPPQVAHTFLFASRPLRRTITGLSHWPFRSDFGFALWFRAERFTGTVTLLSVEGEHSIKIRLVPVPDHEGACTVAVSTGDQTVHEQGFCVLPRVWYHLAVRHTRSRMKGVFKLSTREQLSILLNAKTMVTTESLPFPTQDSAAVKGSTNVTVTLGENFEGQTGAFYLFDDNVSDASLRALYELSARSTMQRSISADNSWDARRGDLVRRSRVLDATITKDDADEIVLSHRRPRRGAAQTISRVIDLMDNSVMEEAEDAPQELSRSSFGSKVFLAWDPRRTVGQLALDLHIGAHVSLDGVFAWSFLGAQDVVSSVGGVQALIPLFRAQLLGNWSASSPYAICMAIPNLFKTLSSFVRDHNDNARELLRCGGVDVIEQLLHGAKKLAAGKKSNTTVFGMLNSHPRLVSLLVDSLFELRAACSHYVGLETKIYSRLLFNINLWFSVVSNVPGSSLQTVLLPVLARLSNENPQKVRDCVGTVEMLHAVKAYAIDRPEHETSSTNRFRESTDDFCPLPLNDMERKQSVKLLLGILFNVLSSGTSPRDFPAYLHLLSFALDDGRATGEANNLTAKQASERRDLAVDLGMLLMLLFQLRPRVPGLFESFAHTCGGVQGGVSWILSSLVDTKDDEIRSIGIRCLGSYLEVTSRGPDSHLSIFAPTESVSGTEMMDSQSEITARTSVRRTTSRFSNLAKGIATMGPSVRAVNVPPSKLTTRVVLKLLWHLLKSHRSDIGSFTHAALLNWVTDDEGSVSSSLSSKRYLTVNMVELLNGQTTFSFNSDWITSRLQQTGSLAAKVLRNPLAISTIFRLLRFLEAEQRDLWLKNILELSKSNRKCVALLASLPEWQHSLFSFLSETLEQVSARRRKELCLLPDQIGESVDVNEESVQREPAAILHKRLDQSLYLYAILLGYLLRSGGDQALEAVEKTAALERVFVNGHDVLLLILSSFCSNIAEEGTLLEIGALSAQDWKDVDLEAILLKQSAKLITDAILSNGTKGLEMATAVRSWRGLRHLLEVIVAITAKCSLGVVDLFAHPVASQPAVDAVSKGLRGVRLTEDRPDRVRAIDYITFLPDLTAFNVRAIDRHLCARLGAQIFSLLDAFIFPQSLGSVASPASPLDGLALVRFNEARLGTYQGPLISSAVRLSFVMLALLEPCSLTFLQCCSRLRCLLCWALELLRDSNVAEGQTLRFHPDGGQHIDRLVVAIVLHCHRALQRCALLSRDLTDELTGHASQRKESHKRYHRRVLRATMELRDVISTAINGNRELLVSSLSPDAFKALDKSLGPGKPASKEDIAHAFLCSSWVNGFQGSSTKNGVAIPDQISIKPISPRRRLGRNRSRELQVTVVEKLAKESSMIVSDFDTVIKSCFEEYLDEQRKWAETDAVRDLEYDGNLAWKRLCEKHQTDIGDNSKTIYARRAGADARWHVIHGKVVIPWKNESHWRLAKHTDRLGRRTLLVQNPTFNNHHDACYDTTLGRDLTGGENHSVNLKKGLSEVMRRNADAFARSDSIDGPEYRDDESSSLPIVSEEESTDDESATTDGVSIAGIQQVIENLPHDEEDEWDKIESEEIRSIDAHGKSDLWARAFIWAESESVVARFEPVVIVSLQTYVEGKVLLTTHGLYFRQLGDEISVMTKQPVESNEAVKDRRWRLTRLTEVHGRRYMLRPQAIELFFSDSHELLLNFPGGFKERDRFYAKLRNSCRVPMLWSTKSLNPRVVFRKSKLTELWRKRKISNFEYLMALNRMAGRSFNDLTQYPVFPWVLADYTSQTIDLSDSRVYRDLSKPVGALNPDRLAQLLERYNDLELFGFPESEKFLYGSHYSSPGIVLHFLIRQEPFTTMAIDLQSGRFDCPDRLFCNMAETWNGCMTSSADMKELIPELFCLPEMFINTNKFPLGVTQSGNNVDNVVLPPWANGSAYEFVRVHRLALESDHVSGNLHHWVDLVFGFKQRGPAAEEAHNIFHHLSYEGSVDLDKIADEIDRNAAESHIQNFGQTPSQLQVEEPHPSRLSEDLCWIPLVREAPMARSLRCHTPSKQFANKRSEYARGAVIHLHVFSDSLIAVYADWSLGSYKWSPASKSNRLRMDKLRPFARRELSVSRTAMKRGSAVATAEFEKSNISVGNWSFGVSLGGQVKEELRRNAILSSGRLMPANEVSLSTAESSALVVSCGYWDDTLKLHNVEGSKVLASETGGHRGPIRCLALGDDGALMVTGGQDCTCRVWVLDHPDMSIALSDGYVQTALGASYDGEQLLTCCHVLWGHESALSALSLDTNFDAVASGGENGLVCVHTLRRGEFIRSFRPPSLSAATPAGRVSALAMGSEGNVVVHMGDKALHTYTINGVRLCSVDAGENLCQIIICSCDQVLVTGGDRCQVLVRNVFDLNVCAMLDLSRHGPIQCLALTPSELNPIKQFLFVGSDDGMITIVDGDPLSNRTNNGNVNGWTDQQNF